MIMNEREENITAYHRPVLLKESVSGLNIRPSGVYVDTTFGGGGHSREILKHLGQDGKLIAFDQDEDARKNLIDDSRFLFIPQNFRYLFNFLKFNGYEQVDGILADLGVSSYQIDTGERGFSMRFDGPLDMRMNKKSSLTAAHIINEYDEKRLADIFFHYGELRNARQIAKVICEHRKTKPYDTVSGLLASIRHLEQRRKENKFFAKVLQALRIEVNDELEALKEMLEGAAKVLKPGGRLVVISYHSLEDRIVKNFIKSGNFEGKIHKDFYGNPLVDFKPVTRKPVVPAEEEILQNKRARSAKMRIAEKL